MGEVVILVRCVRRKKEGIAGRLVGWLGWSYGWIQLGVDCVLAMETSGICIKIVIILFSFFFAI